MTSKPYKQIILIYRNNNICLNQRNKNENNKNKLNLSWDCEEMGQQLGESSGLWILRQLKKAWENHEEVK